MIAIKRERGEGGGDHKLNTHFVKSEREWKILSLGKLMKTLNKDQEHRNLDWTFLQIDSQKCLDFNQSRGEIKIV